MTPGSKSASTCFRISFCFSSECLQGGARLHGSIRIFIYHNLHWSNRCRILTDLRGEYIYEFSNQCLEFGLKLWGSFEDDLRHQLIALGSPPSRQLSPHRKGYASNQCHHRLPINVIMTSLMSLSSVNIRCGKVSYAEECEDVLPQSTRYCHNLYL